MYLSGTRLLGLTLTPRKFLGQPLRFLPSSDPRSTCRSSIVRKLLTITTEGYPGILITTVKATFQRIWSRKRSSIKADLDTVGYWYCLPGQYGRLQWTTPTTLITTCSHIEPCSRFGEGKENTNEIEIVSSIWSSHFPYLYQWTENILSTLVT